MPLRTSVAERSNKRVGSGWARLRSGRLLLALGAGYLAFTACDYSEYPSPATFCDDWCSVLRRKSCDQEPENCVRDCESTLPRESCLTLQSRLLECYRGTPPERFECVEQGFQATVRPRPEICTEQRQALIRCEVPRVMECIEACVALEAEFNAAAEGGVDPSEPLPSPSASCPEPPFPCERLCWELDASFGRGRPTTLTDVDRGNDTNLAALGAPVLRCALSRAAECRAGAAPTTPERSSWTLLLLDCAQLPANLDDLD